MSPLLAYSLGHGNAQSQSVHCMGSSRKQKPVLRFNPNSRILAHMGPVENAGIQKPKSEPTCPWQVKVRDDGVIEAKTESDSDCNLDDIPQRGSENLVSPSHLFPMHVPNTHRMFDAFARGHPWAKQFVCVCVCVRVCDQLCQHVLNDRRAERGTTPKPQKDKEKARKPCTPS